IGCRTPKIMCDRGNGLLDFVSRAAGSDLDVHSSTSASRGSLPEADDSVSLPAVAARAFVLPQLPIGTSNITMRVPTDHATGFVSRSMLKSARLEWRTLAFDSFTPVRPFASNCCLHMCRRNFWPGGILDSSSAAAAVH